MAALGPFEAAPLLTVAVSGGTDSLALLLLAAPWVRARGGQMLALTVDHGLRPQAREEAHAVGAWLAGFGIRHEILSWAGEKPTANIQALARAARYDLLAERAGAAGSLHLLTGHQADDVAETLLLRLGRGSGLAGLAAMASETALGSVRLLRPLLGLTRAQLAAALPAHAPVCHDPSNASPAFARSRIRQAPHALQDLGLSLPRLAQTAHHLRRARAALAEEEARLDLDSAQRHPAGFAWLDPAALAAAPAEVGLRLLARVVGSVGGGAFPPRFGSLERLYVDLVSGTFGAGRTLGGCRVLRRGRRLLICREEAACAPALPPQPMALHQATMWDGRFHLRALRRVPEPVCWGPLGADQPALVPGKSEALPSVVRPSLPTLRDRSGLLAVPHLGWEREAGWLDAFAVAWRPGARAGRISGAASYTVV